MLKFYIILVQFLGCASLGLSQQMANIVYRDLAIPYIEQNLTHYDFLYPIAADVLDSINFRPPSDGVYLKASYGHRYLSSRSSKIDNHGGFDYWANHHHNGVTYSSNNKAPIICMCDGFISEVIHGLDSILEQTAKGRSVQVTCDSIFQSLGSPIQINYRHLSRLDSLATIADTAVWGTIRIKKGDIIGYMGDIGFTSNVHLHLSTETNHPLYGHSFVHTARLFDPTAHSGILQPLNDVKIELLQDWSDSTLFRISWPFHQTINRFMFINQTDTILFDKEAAYATGSIRDEHDCLPNIAVFAYQFNGKRTAKYRYLSEKNNMPAVYPASPQRDTNLVIYGYPHFPIDYDTVGYVYDFVIKNIAVSHLKKDFIVKLSDIWGYTVEGSFSSLLNNKKNKKIGVQVFPNPTEGKVLIQFNQSEKYNIRLFDILGKELLSKENNQMLSFLDLSTFPKGVYLLQIKLKNNTKIIKIVKNTN